MFEKMGLQDYYFFIYSLWLSLSPPFLCAGPNLKSRISENIPPGSRSSPLFRKHFFSSFSGWCPVSYSWRSTFEGPQNVFGLNSFWHKIFLLKAGLSSSWRVWEHWWFYAGVTLLEGQASHGQKPLKAAFWHFTPSSPLTSFCQCCTFFEVWCSEPRLGERPCQGSKKWIGSLGQRWVCVL